MRKENRGLKGLFVGICVFFTIFFVFPMLFVAIQSFRTDDGAGLTNYVRVFSGNGFWTAVGNSFAVAAFSALVTVILAFFLAYAIHYTNLPKPLKKTIETLTVVPMLLPTITYGFSIIYSFGNQGLITRLIGFQPFEIYGWNGK